MSQSVTPAQGMCGPLPGGRWLLRREMPVSDPLHQPKACVDPFLGGLRRCRCLNPLHQPKACVDPFLGERG